MPVIVLCPGQGSQHVKMGKAWAARHPIAARTFEEANAILDLDLASLCFEGPEDLLTRTDMAQAAIFVTTVACFRALRESGEVGAVAATAGLSLGEFTALHLAGAFDFASGLKLVRLRGQAMQEAAEATDSGMVALVGADEQQAKELCAEARGNEVLVPANFNCPGQVVVSGSSGACGRALEVAGKMGLRAAALDVAGAFHSPLMRPAAERLAEALEQTEWTWCERRSGVVSGGVSGGSGQGTAVASKVADVVSNVTARPHETDIDSINQRLVEQLTSPVRWSDSMQWLIENVNGRFIELAPGKVLSGLMRRIDRRARVENYANPGGGERRAKSEEEREKRDEVKPRSKIDHE